VLLGALSTTQKTAIVAMMAIFVVFALVCALVIPRRRPEFPGRGGLAWFVPVCALLFLGMITTILVAAREPHEEAEAAEPPPAETQPAEPQPPAAPAQGDPAAGKMIFAAQGCGSCHTLADAGSTGQIGPNLDDVKPPYALVVRQVTNGGSTMPPFKDSLSEQQIQDVAAYVVQATGGS
jgi:mono/diheme cytochrome c family protein